jgi:protein TonB
LNYLEQQKSPWKNLPGLAVVVLLHLVLIYALVNGLGSSIIDKVKQDMVTKIVQEDKPPPPPPPPPPQDYIPPPEVVVQQPPPPQTHTIVAVQQATKTPFVQHTAPAPVATPDRAFSAAHIIGGANKPESVEDEAYAGRTGHVTVHCTIQEDGHPTNCAIVSVIGGQLFARNTMQWLTGSNPPRYAPEIRGGKPVAVDHTWTISFQAAEE